MIIKISTATAWYTIYIVALNPWLESLHSGSIITCYYTPKILPLADQNYIYVYQSASRQREIVGINVFNLANDH